MSNYTKTTNFATKDTLPSGNAAKVVRGTEIDTEFNNIATAIATKVDAIVGQLQLAAGSAGVPAYSFSTSTATGMYLPSANELGFSCNGVLGGFFDTGAAFNLANTSVPSAAGLYSPATNTLGFGTAGTARGSVNATGNWTIPAPTSGAALALTGVASSSTVLLLTAGASGGAGVKATDASGSYLFGSGILTPGVWSVYDATNSAERLKISSAGVATLNAPSSGIAWNVTGTAAQSIAQFTSGNSATQQSSDVVIQRAGSTANSVGAGPSLQLFDSTNTTAFNLQQSGSQSEFWQLNGSWKQMGYFGTDYNLHIRDDGGTMQLAGYRGTPYNAQTTSYTLVLSDRGKSIGINASGTTVTVPPSVFTIGDVITLVANNFGATTIAQGAGVTIYWANGTNTTGNRTLTGVGIATLLYVGGNSWFIAGSGLS